METVLVVGLLALFGVLETLAGVYSHAKLRSDDWIINLVSLGHLSIIVRPAMLGIVAFVLGGLAPEFEGSLASTPLWIAVLAVLLSDEFLHYWYHRRGHEWGWLRKIHRTHHTTPSLNVGVSYRENILWFVLMPNLWYGALAIFLGLGQALVISTMIIGTVLIITHAGIDYDRVLYQGRSGRLLRPLISVLECIIVFPDTHRAHHGFGEWSHEQGNYSTLVFFYDVIFGTAALPHHPPASIGIENDPKDPWYVQLYRPFVKASDPSSELATTPPRQTVSDS
ncbi:MAG: sterol desaturase family protein [Deltaproteobacteria bacterium]|nr:sterol desaturase family protein [Deltaproteobacteria bacterium]